MTMQQDEIADILVRIDERTRQIQEQLEEMSHAVYGNGKPGLLVDVAVINSRLHTVEESAKESKVPRAVWIGIVSSLVVSVAEIVFRLM